MTLRRQIITASMVAGALFTAMLSWMAWCTYPVPVPDFSSLTVFTGIVLLFWWLVGSIVADATQQQTNRTVTAIRAKLEDGISLRRRADRQRDLLQQFTRDTVPLVMDIAQQAQRAAQQSQGMAKHAQTDLSLAQLAELAEECSLALARLTEHANLGLAQSQLLQHDLTSLTTHEAQLATQLHQLQRLAQQCNILALNAAIETARTLDRSRGVGLLTEEIKQLGTATESMARTVQSHAHALRDQANQSLRTAEPMRRHIETMASEALQVNALADEQWEVMDGMRASQHAMGDPNTTSTQRQHLLTSAETMKSASASLKRSLESLMTSLHVAA